MFALVVASGCYAHESPSTRAVDHPALIRPIRGRYVITAGRERLGEERFEISTTSEIWRAAGEIHIERPVEQTERYRIDIDLASREPIGFELTLELAGEKEVVVGRREGPYFAVEAQTLAGDHLHHVPYAAGTALDLGTPLSSTLALSLLGPSLEERKPVAVRTISIAPPNFEPNVMLQLYELRGRDEGARRVAVSRTSGELLGGFWIREDGLPVRVRIVRPDGSSFEQRLELEPEPR